MFDYQFGEKTAGVPEVDFGDAREMQPYLAAPDAMYVGAPGKQGYLRMVFEISPEGKCVMSDLERRVPIIVQQELYFDRIWKELPCVYILSSGGGNLDGDRYQQDIYLKKNAFAWVSTGAATKLCEMKRNYSGMKQHITLEENAYLEFMPEPVIPCRNTRFICDSELVVHPTATLFYSEIYMGGRKHYEKPEMFDYDILSVCCKGMRPDETHDMPDADIKTPKSPVIFREKFVIEPGRLLNPRQLGVMGLFDVFANVIVMTPPDKAEEIYSRTQAYLNPEEKMAAGISRLPNNAGILFKVLGMEPVPVKKVVRKFCSTVREVVKGMPVADEFPWR